MRPLRGDGVDRGRRLAGVDRAAHQGQGPRPARILVGAHQRGGGIAGHRRLADREHVRARADMLEELDQIVDIIVEVEAAGIERDELGVAPVGDEDVVARQHPLDRAAQQRRIMARHRRDDQQLRPVLHALAAEMLELAERLAEHDLLVDGDAPALDAGRSRARTRACRAAPRRGRRRRAPRRRSGPSGCRRRD